MFVLLHSQKYSSAAGKLNDPPGSQYMSTSSSATFTQVCAPYPRLFSGADAAIVGYRAECMEVTSKGVRTPCLESWDTASLRVRASQLPPHQAPIRGTCEA